MSSYVFTLNIVNVIFRSDVATIEELDHSVNIEPESLIDLNKSLPTLENTQLNSSVIGMSNKGKSIAGPKKVSGEFL